MYIYNKKSNIVIYLLVYKLNKKNNFTTKKSYQLLKSVA